MRVLFLFLFFVLVSCSCFALSLSDWIRPFQGNISIFNGDSGFENNTNVNVSNLWISSQAGGMPGLIINNNLCINYDGQVIGQDLICTNNKKYYDQIQSPDLSSNMNCQNGGLCYTNNIITTGDLTAKFEGQIFLNVNKYNQCNSNKIDVSGINYIQLELPDTEPCDLDEIDSYHATDGYIVSFYAKTDYNQFHDNVGVHGNIKLLNGAKWLNMTTGDLCTFTYDDSSLLWYQAYPCGKLNQDIPQNQSFDNSQITNLTVNNLNVQGDYTSYPFDISLGTAKTFTETRIGIGGATPTITNGIIKCKNTGSITFISCTETTSSSVSNSAIICGVEINGVQTLNGTMLAVGNNFYSNYTSANRYEYNMTAAAQIAAYWNQTGSSTSNNIQVTISGVCD